MGGRYRSDAGRRSFPVPSVACRGAGRGDPGRAGPFRAAQPRVTGKERCDMLRAGLPHTCPHSAIAASTSSRRCGLAAWTQFNYLAQLGGVARTGQLLAAGYSRTDIAGLTEGRGAPTQARSLRAARVPAGARGGHPAQCPRQLRQRGGALRPLAEGNTGPAPSWPATTATEPASSGTGPSGSTALPSCQWPRSRTLCCMPSRVCGHRHQQPWQHRPCACMAFPLNC